MSKHRHGGRRAGANRTELKRGWAGRIEGRPQLRARHKGALTQVQIETFLASLAETCNVAASARAAGRRVARYYDLRRRDSEFRAFWMEALREGYDLLETEILERARFGAPKDVFYQGQKVGTTRVHNDALALRLLQRHRSTVERSRVAGEERGDPQRVFDALAARIAEIEAEEPGREAA